MIEGHCAYGVASDDEELDPMPDEVVCACPCVSNHCVGTACPIRDAGCVTQVDQILGGQRIANGAGNREASKSGIEYADGGVIECHGPSKQ